MKRCIQCICGQWQVIRCLPLYRFISFCKMYCYLTKTIIRLCGIADWSGSYYSQMPRIQIFLLHSSMKHWESLCGLHAAPTSAHLLVKHWEPLCGLHAAPTSAQLLVKHWKSLCGLHAAPTSAQLLVKHWESLCGLHAAPTPFFVFKNVLLIYIYGNKEIATIH